MIQMTGCLEKMFTELKMLSKSNEMIETFNQSIKKLNLKKNIKYVIFPGYNLILLYEDFIYKSPIIFSTHTLLPICSFYNTPIIDNNAVESLSSVQWSNSNVVVHKSHLDGLHICLFWYIGDWYILSDTIISKTSEVSNKITNIFKNTLTEQLQTEFCLDTLDKNLVYHFLLKHPSFDNIGSKSDTNSISLLYICDSLLRLWENDNMECTGIIKNVPMEKKYYFSCLDEFLTSLEITNDCDVTHRSLTSTGYSIFVLSENKTSYTNYIIRTNIYKHIISIIPAQPNKYIGYLELYQKNILSEILPYIHKYPLCVVKRINVSIKTISKETLNIYHLTRQKQNTPLYECLSPHYKKTLYDLHKIYVTQKYGEYIVKSNELLKEKKSISVDIVYNYLKSLPIDDLVQLFIDRKTLINHLSLNNNDYGKILIVDNIDMIAQMELMEIN